MTATVKYCLKNSPPVVLYKKVLTLSIIICSQKLLRLEHIQKIKDGYIISQTKEKKKTKVVKVDYVFNYNLIT